MHPLTLEQAAALSRIDDLRRRADRQRLRRVARSLAGDRSQLTRAERRGG